MQGDIVGETELLNGLRTLAFRENDYDVILLSFDKEGKANVVKRYEDLEQDLMEKLKYDFLLSVP